MKAISINKAIEIKNNIINEIIYKTDIKTELKKRENKTLKTVINEISEKYNVDKIIAWELILKIYSC